MKYNDSRTRAKNRQKIVDVARKLFTTNGIAHTTIMEIVKAVEMERKTFYNYFKDKEEIADYIYFTALREFYNEGFKVEDYTNCENGYEKIKRYFHIIVKAFEKHPKAMLFVVHHDYYFRKEMTEELMDKIYAEVEITDPYLMYKEGIEDGSIKDVNGDPKAYFMMISQSIGAFASRIIFRTFKESIQHTDISLLPVYELVENHLVRIKK